jgi:GTPase SAR1 family protein
MNPQPVAAAADDDNESSLPGSIFGDYEVNRAMLLGVNNVDIIDLIVDKVLDASDINGIYDCGTCDMFTDPVCTSDGQTYERSTILGWHDTCVRTGRPFTSPNTGVVISVEDIRPNVYLRKVIDSIRNKTQVAARNAHLGDKPTSKVLYDNVQRIKKLESKFFRDMDKLMAMNLNVMDTLKLKVCVFVALGLEGSGKSTLLERLLQMSLFPRNPGEVGMCTKTIVRLILRRGKKQLPYVIKKHRKKDWQSEPIFLETTRDICIAVQNIMNEIMNDESERGNLVSENYEIHVYVTSENCPDLTVVDVPGLVSNQRVDPTITQDVPAATRRLAEETVEAEADSAIFLVVVDIKMQTNQVGVMKIIQDADLCHNAIGIYTHIDELKATDRSRKAYADRLESDRKSYPLSGWCFASSTDENDGVEISVSAGDDETANSLSKDNALSRLVRMDINEDAYFRKDYKQFYDDGIAGLPIIRGILRNRLEQFLNENWCPHITDALSGYFRRQYDANMDLGAVPALKDYEPYHAELIRDVPVYLGDSDYDVNVFVPGTKQVVKKGLCDRVVDVCKDAKKWQKLSSATPILTAKRACDEFVNKPPWDSIDNIDTAKALEMEKAAKVRLRNLLMDLIKALRDHRNNLTANFIEELVDKSASEVVITRSEKKRGFISGLFGWLSGSGPSKDEIARRNQEVWKQPNATKYDRFEHLIDSFREHVLKEISKISEEFEARATEKSERWLTDDDLFDDAITDTLEEIRIGWESSVYSYPNRIVKLWFETVSNKIPCLTDSFNLTEACLIEAKKDERLTVLKNMTNAVKALADVRELRLNVERAEAERNVRSPVKPQVQVPTAVPVAESNIFAEVEY